MQLIDILSAVEDEGYIPGTPEFEQVVRAKSVEHCQQAHNVRACSACPAYLDCPLSRAHIADIQQQHAPPGWGRGR
jgi:hypothetical protein